MVRRISFKISKTYFLAHFLFWISLLIYLFENRINLQSLGGMNSLLLLFKYLLAMILAIMLLLYFITFAAKRKNAIVVSGDNVEMFIPLWWESIILRASISFKKTDICDIKLVTIPILPKLSMIKILLPNRRITLPCFFLSECDYRFLLDNFCHTEV